MDLLFTILVAPDVALISFYFRLLRDPRYRNLKVTLQSKIGGVPNSQQ